MTDICANTGKTQIETIHQTSEYFRKLIRILSPFESLAHSYNFIFSYYIDDRIHKILFEEGSYSIMVNLCTGEITRVGLYDSSTEVFKTVDIRNPTHFERYCSALGEIRNLTQVLGTIHKNPYICI